MDENVFNDFSKLLHREYKEILSAAQEIEAYRYLSLAKNTNDDSNTVSVCVQAEFDSYDKLSTFMNKTNDKLTEVVVSRFGQSVLYFCSLLKDLE